MTQQRFLDTAFDKGLQLAFPPVMVQLLKALLEPEPSFERIAGFLEMDAMLAARVLHVVNTSNYGFSSKFTNLHRAAVVIGTADLFKLVISLSMQKRLNPVSGVEPKQLYADWRLTLWSALAGEAIAEKLCPEFRNEAYLGGMLKDLPLYLAISMDRQHFALDGSRPVTLYDAAKACEELALWGRTHQELARDILLSWGFPMELAEAVRHHHDFSMIATGTPLTRCLVYAARWAELIQSPRPDPEQIIAFELALAAELEYDRQAMETFREACLERFTKLTEQLGLKRHGPDALLHEKSLTDIQSCYFLALGALRDITSSDTGRAAVTLQQHLRLFWGITSWALSLILPENGDSLRLSCENGKLLMADTLAPPSGWSKIPLSVEDASFGWLAVDMPETPVSQSSLPTFIHMLSFCLDEDRKKRARAVQKTGFSWLPFNFARLDSKGRILESSHCFRETFGITDQADVVASELLYSQLGLSRSRLSALTGEREQGCVVTVPENALPGTPVYVSRKTALDHSGDSFLLLADVGGLDSEQALASGVPGFMAGLLSGIRERICLIGKDGRIHWDSATNGDLAGHSLFAVLQPENVSPEAWRQGFLGHVIEPVTFKALMSTGLRDIPCEASLTPLQPDSFLLVLYFPGGCGEALRGDSSETKSSSSRDTLTGLYGYSQFHVLLKHFTELGRNQQTALGILFCDIESLHEINEQFGCRRGDALLRATAGILTNVIRQGQDFPSRYGADKFVVLATRATQGLLDAMAAKVQQRAMAQREFALRLNIGIALLEPGQDPRERLDAARKAGRLAANSETRIRWAR